MFIHSEITLFLQNLQEQFESSPLLKPFFHSILAFGYKSIDTNILVLDPSLECNDTFTFSNNLYAYYAKYIWNKPTIEEQEDNDHDGHDGHREISGKQVRRMLFQKYHTAIENGFKLACEAGRFPSSFSIPILWVGPLCGETMWGNLFILEDLFLLPPSSSSTPREANTDEDEDEDVEVEVEVEVKVEEGEEEKEEKQREEMKRMMMEVEEMQARTYLLDDVEAQLFELPTGSLITLVKQLCHQAFSQASARIAEPMYRCILQCSSDQLGKLYNVLNQRRGEVQNEDIWEGTDIFTITSILPVTESMGLANDLRQQTSGAVNQPQLQFSHWQILDEDPFSKPITEDEKEEWGERFGTRNRAKQIIDSIRKRKGMQTDEKIVENAEKQRTMKSK